MASKVTPKAPGAGGKDAEKTSTSKVAAKKNVELRDLKRPAHKVSIKKGRH